MSSKSRVMKPDNYAHHFVWQKSLTIRLWNIVLYFLIAYTEPNFRCKKPKLFFVASIKALPTCRYFARMTRQYGKHREQYADDDIVLKGRGRRDGCDKKG